MFAVFLLFSYFNFATANFDPWGNLVWINDTITEPLCKNYDKGIQIPDSTDSSNYYICCGNSLPKVKFSCTWQSKEEQYPLFKKTYYNPFTGQCENEFKNSTNKTIGIVTEYAKKVCSTYVPNETNVEYKNAKIKNTVFNIGKFEIIGSTGILAIHSALIPNTDTLLLWDRRIRDNTPYPPGTIGKDGNPEVSGIYDTITRKYYITYMRTTPFCSGGSHLDDGSVFVAGGDEGANQTGMLNGLRNIRKFGANNWYTSNVLLREPRWYPSQVQLPDGFRTVVMGGSTKEGGGPVYSAEVYDARKNTISLNYTIPTLQKNGANYPTVFVLPWTFQSNLTTLFVFNCKGGSLTTVDGNGNFKEKTVLPNLPILNICSATSAGGSSVLNMLKPENNYLPTVSLFGGYQQIKSQCKCDIPSHDMAFTMKLDKNNINSGKIAWEVEKMPYNRNMADAVLLPNGKILIVNGVKNGIFSTARNPVYEAWLYNPDAIKGKRFSQLSSSTIPRRYHSTAILLPDASVMIAGSETAECSYACAKKWKFYDYQFTSEIFYPPYYFSTMRPTIKSISPTLQYMNNMIHIYYQGNVSSVVLMKPGAVTHQNNMGQRGIKLQILANDKKGHIIVRMPPKGGLVAQPGWYMLFILNGDIPCVKAKWIRLFA